MPEIVTSPKMKKAGVEAGSENQQNGMVTPIKKGLFGSHHADFFAYNTMRKAGNDSGQVDKSWNDGNRSNLLKTMTIPQNKMAPLKATISARPPQSIAANSKVAPFTHHSPKKHSE